MKEAAEPLPAVAPAIAAPVQTGAVPAGAVGLVLGMQTSHGNAYVSRLLAQQRAGTLSRMPIRKGAGHGSLAEAEKADIFESPSESSKKVGTLEKGKTVDLTSEEPGFYGVIAEGQKGYVKSSELVTAIDELPAAKDAEFAARAKAASDAMDAAGHAAGKALRGAGTAPAGSGGALPDWFRQLQYKLSMVTTWAKEEDDAQQVLDDYMTFYMEAWHGDVPPSVKYPLRLRGAQLDQPVQRRQGRLRQRREVRRRHQRQGQAEPQLVHADQLERDRQRVARHGLRADGRDRGVPEQHQPSRRSAARRTSSAARPPTRRRCSPATRSCTCSTAASTAATP